MQTLVLLGRLESVEQSERGRLRGRGNEEYLGSTLRTVHCALHTVQYGKQLSQTAAAAATGLDTNNVETCGLFLLFDNIAFCGFNTSIESIE